MVEAFTPYGPGGAVVRPANGENGHYLNQYGPVDALLATSEGLWAAGPGWLMTPDFAVTTLADAPRYQDVWDVIVGAGGRLWVASRPRPDGYQGAVQTLDDRGTVALEDDRWEGPELGPVYECRRVTVLDRWGSDTWYATSCASRTGPPPLIMRDHNGANVTYAPALPYFSVVSDIFVIDARRAWFAVVDRSYRGGAYLVGLDDGGTPLKLDDDVWQTLDIGVAQGLGSVAVDAQGQLWRGQSDGLYRYDGAEWWHEYDGLAVCDLTPALDGALYAQLERHRGAGCEKFSDTVLKVKPDGTVERYATTVEALVYGDAVSVRSAKRRNSMWAIAADGAIWYVARRPEGSEVRRVARFWTLTRYAAPFDVDSVRRLEVDALGRAWVVAEGRLWRMEGPRFGGIHLPILMR
jgi:hypothetical protein